MQVKNFTTYENFRKKSVAFKLTSINNNRGTNKPSRNIKMEKQLLVQSITCSRFFVRASITTNVKIRKNAIKLIVFFSITHKESREWFSKII